MSDNEKKIEITILYPRRQGFILKAHNLQQELAAQFDLSVRLEEHIDQSFKVLLNGQTLYTNPTEDNSHIDHQKIISSLRVYKKPAKLKPKEPAQPDYNDDPDHLRWMNSVCSGE